MRETSFFINVERPEIRVAEILGGRLHDLEIEREGRLLGDIYLGAVENIIPGMDAAFIDIGTGRNALLYAGDIESADQNPRGAEPIEKVLKSGQAVLVQVARAPVGTKGARVTGKISLPGRYTVLAASSDTVGVSRRIESADERERLRRLVEKHRPLDHGVIVRTEGEGASADDLATDIAFGFKQLQHLKARAAAEKPPMLLHRDLGILGRLARDRLGESIDRIVFDTRAEYESFRALVELLAPRFLDRVQLHAGKEPLFSHFGIERDIARAAERSVALPHGGTLVIDEAEALTAIDVNTGKFTGKNRLADTVLQTNLEAVEEAARQLRLRNIGGVVVIDFIDMERTRDRIKVMDALETALKGDRTRTRIVQLSPLGLVEMTRRREGDSLRRLIHRACPYCAGDGLVRSAQSVAIEARRQARESLLSGQIGDAVRVTLSPEVAVAFLGEGDEWTREWEETCGAELWLHVDLSFHVEKTVVERGSARTFEQARTALALGQRVALPPGAIFRNAAGFVALGGVLTQIDTKETAEGDARPAIIEIIRTGRWYHVARMIFSVDPRDE